MLQATRFIKPIFWLAGWLALCGSSAFAQNTDTIPDQPEQRIYDVEIILFKNVSVPKGHEVNLPTPAAEHSPQMLDLNDPAQVQQASEKGFSALAMDDLRLLEEASKIIRSSRYQLLAHIGWRQPGLDKDNAIGVWIRAGETFDKSYSSIDQLEATSVDPAASDQVDRISEDPVKPALNGQQLYELEGSITIILARYLHAQTDLVLRKPATMESLLQTNPDGESPVGNVDAEKVLTNHALKERRRMRSRVLHYLDSPELGMLVQITPYEKPQDLPTEVSAEASGETPVALDPPPTDSPAVVAR